MRRALLALLLSVLGLAAGAAGCDPTGGDRACPVKDGFYRAVTPDGGGPYPTVVYLYGSGGNSTDVLERRSVVDLMRRRGYALIVPAAHDIDYVDRTRTTGWTIRGGAARDRDEIAFLRQVLVDAERRFYINPRAVLIFGQSRGGFLAWDIACRAPDLALGFASNAGGFFAPPPSRCKVAPHVFASHGINDTVVPIDGDEHVVPAMQGLALFAKTAGCRAPDLSNAATREGNTVAWPGCRTGSSVTLRLHQSGHNWPRGLLSDTLDWFEGVRRGRPAIWSEPKGGNARFTRPGDKKDNRFKRVPGP